MIPTRALLLLRLLHSAATIGGIALFIAGAIECSLIRERLYVIF